jgi:hypothetical protein
MEKRPGSTRPFFKEKHSMEKQSLATLFAVEKMHCGSIYGKAERT